MVIRNVLGIIIRSSENTTPNVVDKYFSWAFYSSGISSIVLRSWQTSVFSNFSSFNFSVAIVFKSVVKFCSACLMVFSGSQLLFLNMSCLPHLKMAYACRPKYLLSLTAGTSNESFNLIDTVSGVSGD